MGHYTKWLPTTLAAEQERLFLWAPVLLGLGIALYFWLPAEPPWWAALPGLGLSGWAAWHCRRQLPNAGMLPLLVVAGFMAAQLETARLEAPMLTRDTGFTEFTGRVVMVEPLPTGRRVTIGELTIPSLPDRKKPATIRLLDRKAADPLAVGDRISGKAFLRAISEPVLPGDYDFRRNAFFNRLGATGFLAGPFTITQAAGQGISFDSARAKLQAEISKTLQGDSAAISDALLTGEQQGIGEDTLTAMRLSGLTHILSVSGLHIGLAATLFFFLVRALLALSPYLALNYPIKKWAAVVALAGATAYTLFAEAPVPAVRSLLMTGIALGAIMVDRSALSLRTIALSAVLILLVVPDSLLGPSFQLSYAAIIGIIAAYEGSESWRERWAEGRGRPRNIILRGLLYVGAIAITSLVASLATAPLTHYHFQQLSFYGVIANMLAVPLTSFWLMPAALLALFLLPFGLCHWPLVVLGKGVELLMTIAVRTAELPGADWAPANLPLPGVLAIVAGLLWLLIWQRRWRWAGLVPVAAGLIIALFPAQPELLLSSDGKYAALRSKAGYILVSDTGRRHLDSFIPDQWRRWLGVKTYIDGNDFCDALGCGIGEITIVRDSNILPILCSQDSGWLVYPAGRLSRCGNPGRKIIDEPDLWRGGALALYENGTLDTTQSQIGFRPWSIRQPYRKDD